MITPLYKEYQTLPSKPEGAHTGLWFDRFFNHYATDWTLDSSAKKAWIKKVGGHAGDTKKLEVFNNRQIALVAQLQGASQRYTCDWHFVTGMGNSHPVENGFSWHPTLAVPYLAGTSVKGLVRAWVERNDEDLSEELEELKVARLKSWFGSEDKEKEKESDQTGDFIFFDALPDVLPQLACDIMTPHMGKWYSDGDKACLNDSATIPADWHEPVPVPFLVVKKTRLVFHIAPRKKHHQAELEHVFYALSQALEWLGAGAKTAAGYGYMSKDIRYNEELKAQQAEQQAKHAKEQALKVRLAGLSPLAQDYFKQADQGDWQNNKNNFLQAGLIEGWLDLLEATPDKTILADMINLLDHHMSGLLQDPDKVKGKPGKEKPVYKERQCKIAHRINALR